MIRRLCIKFFLFFVVLSMHFAANIPCFAVDYSVVKKDCYKVLAESLYDKDIYGKFKLEVIEKLGRLSNLSEDIYEKQNYENSNTYKVVKNVLASITKKLNTTQKSNYEDIEKQIEKKIAFLSSQGDSSIAYILKDLLTSDDYTYQLYAATALMKNKEPDAYEILMELLNSDKGQQKLVALKALSNLENKGAVPDIVKIIEDDTLRPKFRINAIKTLVSIDPETAKTTLPNILKTSDKDIKYEIIMNLLMLGNTDVLQDYEDLVFEDKEAAKKLLKKLPDIVGKLQEESLPFIKKMIQSDDDVYRGIGVTSLSRLDNLNGVYDLLSQTVFDDNINVKIISYGLLTKIQNEEVVSVLNQVEFPENQYTNKAYNILISADNPKLTPMLDDLLANGNNIQRFSVALKYIAKEATKAKAVKVLYELLKSKNKILSYQSAYALIENDYPVDINIINDMLDSNNPNIKAKTYILLASRKDKSIISKLEKYLEQNSDYKQGYGAAILLYNLGNNKYQDILQKYLSQKNIYPISKQYMNIDLFFDLLKDSHPWVRLNSAKTLLNADEVLEMDVLLDLLHEDDFAIRSEASSLLGQYGNVKNIANLEKLLDDNFVQVRVNASEAILRILNRNRSQN